MENLLKLYSNRGIGVARELSMEKRNRVHDHGNSYTSLTHWRWRCFCARWIFTQRIVKRWIHVPYKPMDFSRSPVQHSQKGIPLHSAKPKTVIRDDSGKCLNEKNRPTLKCNTLTWSIERSNSWRLCTAVWSILPRLMTTLFKLV